MSGPSKRFWVNILFLTAAVILTYFWTKNPVTSAYTLQLIALFVLFYFLNQAKGGKKAKMFINTLVFTIVILLLVASTGGLTSPLFFLVYFLLFGASFLLEPTIIFTFTFILIAFFLLLTPSIKPENFITLTSLLFIAPLALFFGKQYLKVLESKREIKVLNKAIKKEETDSLLWLSLELKNNLQRIIKRTNELLKASFDLNKKEKLEEILASAQRLLRTGEKLKKEVDEATD